MPRLQEIFSEKVSCRRGIRRIQSTSISDMATRRRDVEEEYVQLATLLLFSHEEGDLEEEELLLLLLALQGNAIALMLPPLQRVGDRFCLDNLDEEACLGRFRFRKAHLSELHDALGMPGHFQAPCRTTWTSLEGLLVVLRWLAYPGRLRNLCEEFGRSKPVLSLMINQTMAWLWQRWGDTLEDQFTKPFFSDERITRYGEAISKYSSVELLLRGFIDGTLRRICRPEEHQREFHSGYKRAHCIKFQGVATPDGLLTCLHGPFEGRRHDAGVFGQTGLREQLQNRMHLPAGVYALHADAACPLSLYLQEGYQGHHLTPAQQVFNTSMSSARQSVEWSFGEVSTIFPPLSICGDSRR